MIVWFKLSDLTRELNNPVKTGVSTTVNVDDNWITVHVEPSNDFLKMLFNVYTVQKAHLGKKEGDGDSDVYRMFLYDLTKLISEVGVARSKLYDEIWTFLNGLHEIIKKKESETQ